MFLINWQMEGTNSNYRYITNMFCLGIFRHLLTIRTVIIMCFSSPCRVPILALNGMVYILNFFCTLPLGWKASAFIHLYLGLFVTGAVRSLGVPVSRYTDDRHVSQLFCSPARTSLVPSEVLAEAATYVMFSACRGGLFYWYCKVTVGCVHGYPLYWFLVRFIPQATLLPDDKRLKLSSFIEQILASRDVGLRKLQEFARKVFT